VKNMSQRGGSRNRLLVEQANQAMDQMKYEIATEFGIQLGADQASRVNGSVGGEMVKRLIQFGEQSISGAAGTTTSR
jgi:hypothetical protein